MALLFLLGSLEHTESFFLFVNAILSYVIKDSEKKLAAVLYAFLKNVNSTKNEVKKSIYLFIYLFFALKRVN